MYSGSNKQNSGCIKAKDGSIIFENDKVLERWTEYIGDLFQDERSTVPTPENNDGPPILRAEVENAIKKTPNGKSPGDDGITAEMIKPLEDFGVDKLLEIYSDMYESGYIMIDLLTSIFITLPKKHKATECSDHRTISLMPHVMKIFLKIIQDRIRAKLDKEVGETQFGFRANKGTREGIFCMNILAQKHIEVNKELYVCFIDYSKAFDRVHHAKLIECLEKVGIDGKDIRIIANLYWYQKAAIRIQNETSDFTDIQRGVRQGCVLSPYLFNIYTEFIFRETEELQGVHVNGINVNNVRYADDTALVTDNVNNLQAIVTEIKEQSSKAGLDMNIKKTKTMVIAKNPGTKIDIKVDGETLEQVDKFKYLGATITEDGRSETEIKTRIGLAKSKFSYMSKLMTSRKLSLKLKLKILNCYVFSIFAYGAEAWTLTKVLEDRINALEMWCLRKIGKVSWKEKKTNKEVCTLLGTHQKLLNKIKTRKLTYFGHIERQQSFLKQVLEGKLEGKRPRGRPRYTWADNIKQWTKRSFHQCVTAAQERNEWGVIASQPLETR